MKLLGGRRPSNVVEAVPLDPDHIRVAYACASWLLGYPDDALVERLTIMRDAIAGLPERLGEPLTRTLDALATTDSIEAAQTYVDTFDTRRRGCLFLTYFSNGDTRRRGMALVRIRQIYLAAGLRPSTDELPDHLTVVLEFAAGTSLRSGMEILVANRPGLELLREHLASIDSPWHGAVEAVCATLPNMTDAEVTAMWALAAEGPAEELVGLDGYGTEPNFDSIHPASRPGPTFDGSSCPSNTARVRVADPTMHRATTEEVVS